MSSSRRRAARRRRRSRVGWSLAVSGIVGSGVVGPSPVARAENVTYIGLSGGPGATWSNVDNWSPPKVPVNGDDVTVGNFPFVVSGPADITYDYSYTGSGLNSFTLTSFGVFNPAYVFFDQTDAATAMVAKTETIGDTRFAAYRHAGGSNTAGTLYVGLAGANPITINGITNSYEMQTAGAVLHVTGDEVIGVHSGGGGDMAQRGGTHTVDGILTIGRDYGSAGQFILGSTTANATLSAGNEFVGNSGVAEFVQGAGSNTTNILVIGADPAAMDSSTYRLGGTGTLNARIIAVGNGGFIHNAGTVNVGSVLRVGTLDASNVIGTYGFANGTLTAPDEIIGDAGFGLFDHGSGTAGSSNTVAAIGTSGTGTLTLGNLAGGHGIYDLSGSSGVNQLTAHDEVIGESGFGQFNQLGGTNTFTHRLTLGHAGGTGNGAYTFSDGELVGGRVVVGDAGAGTFAQSGGTLHANDGIYLGLQPAGGAVRSFQLTSGKADAPSMVVGALGKATVDHSAGSLVLATGTDSDGVSGLRVGNGPGSDGTYTLSGTATLSSAQALIGNLGKGVFKHNDGLHEVLGGLTLGEAATGQGAYELAAGTLHVSNGASETVANHGAGVFTQTGGTHSVAGQLFIATEAGSSGTYLMSGGGSVLTVGSREAVGFAGTATFAQAGGTHNVGDKLGVGVAAGGSGTFILSGGTFHTGADEFIGDAGTGTFSHGGGATHTGDTNLVLGNAATGQGQYELSGAASQLTVAVSEIVGNSGTGTFTQNDGANVITAVKGGLFVGNASGGKGTYALKGGSLTTTQLTVGNFAGSTGTFTQTGGSAQASVDFLLGFEAGATGAYQLGGGSLAMSSEVRIGQGGTGTFTQSGGTATAGAAGGAGAFRLGNLAGGDGSYTMTGGANALTVHVFESIGTDGAGAFLQRVGTHTADGDVQLASSAGGTGTYTLTGGAFNVGANIGVGHAGHGTFGQTNGSVSVTQGLFLGSAATGVGTWQLDGGSVTADTEHVGFFGSGTFNQTAGTNVAATSLTIAENAGSSGAYSLGGTGVLTVNGQGLNNKGTFTLAGGTLNGSGPKVNNATLSGFGHVAGTGALTNNGTATFTGGVSTIDTDVTNKAGHQLTVLNNPATFNGAVTNEASASIKVTNTTVTFNGPFTNNGGYVTDPAVQTFTDLLVGPTGYFQGGAGDVLNVGHDLTNQSLQDAAFDLSAARLALAGDAAHVLAWPGADLGPSGAGYFANFALGILELGPNASLTLADGSPAVPGGAIYTRELLLDGGLAELAGIHGNGLSIYYDPADPANAYLNDASYPLADGGAVAPAPVPEPAGVAALAIASLVFGSRRRRRRRVVANPVT